MLILSCKCIHSEITLLCSILMQSYQVYLYIFKTFVFSTNPYVCQTYKYILVDLLRNDVIKTTLRGCYIFSTRNYLSDILV